jgi:hypothetical protein
MSKKKIGNLIYAVAFLLLSIGLLLTAIKFFKSTNGTIEVESNGKKVRVNMQNIDFAMQQVISDTTQYHNQVTKTKEIYNTTEDVLLRDSLRKLIRAREDDISLAEDVLNQYSRIQQMDMSEKKQFVEQTINYFSSKVNPTRKLDYSLIASNLVNEKTILEKDFAMQAYTLTFDTLKKQIGTKEIQIKKFLEQLKTKIAEINSLEGYISSYKKDSIFNRVTIDSLEHAIGNAYEAKQSLENTIDNYVPIRSQGTTVLLPQCKSRADGSYKINCAKSNGLKLKFKPVSNTDPTNKEVKLKIFFSYPSNDPGKVSVKKIPVQAILNKEEIISLSENISFLPGMYYVQIFYYTKGDSSLVDYKPIEIR